MMSAVRMSPYISPYLHLENTFIDNLAMTFFLVVNIRVDSFNLLVCSLGVLLDHEKIVG